MSGSEFVHLGEGELGGLAMGAPAQARVLRMLRAYDAFSEIDACGTWTWWWLCCKDGGQTVVGWRVGGSAQAGPPKGLKNSPASPPGLGRGLGQIFRRVT